MRETIDVTIEVAVIGAGWAGLAAATALKEAGKEVVVLEKARGPGGRCATRRQDGYAFDHGAQYFTARSDAFRRQVDSWRELGLIAPWLPRIKVIGDRPDNAGKSPDERLVGVPGMNAVLHHLAESLDCRFGQRVESMTYQDGWQLVMADGSQLEARQVVLTAPPQQAAALLGSDHVLYEQLMAVPMSPCWALMVGFEQALDVDFDAAFINEGPLSWLARNSAKPGRGGEAWVAHASGEWSGVHLEDEAEIVAERLMEAVFEVLPGVDRGAARLVSVHRWRYALCSAPLGVGCLSVGEQGLVVAGDWCDGNRVEGAWVSGVGAGGLVSSS